MLYHDSCSLAPLTIFPKHYSSTFRFVEGSRAALTIWTIDFGFTMVNPSPDNFYYNLDDSSNPQSILFQKTHSSIIFPINYPTPSKTPEQP